MAKIVSSTMNEFQLDFKKYKISLISKSLLFHLAENKRKNKANKRHNA